MKKAIAIDFDGCLCANAFPDIGAPHWDVIIRAAQERAAGAGLILWTCREGERLQAALEACERWGLHFDAVNESLPEWIEAFGTKPRKVGATEYWDDRAVRLPASACSDWSATVCQRAVDTYGKEAQLIICMEEMAELTKELSKNLRGQENRQSVAEEIADVEIMLEQLKLIFGNGLDVASIRGKKLLRLEEHLRQGRCWRQGGSA